MITSKINTAALNIEIFESINLLPSSVFQDFLPKNSCLLSQNYFSNLENTLQDEFKFRYAVFSSETNIVGLAFFQIIQVEGNLLNDREIKPKANTETSSSWVDYGKDKMRNLFNAYKFRMLICGNTLMTGARNFFYNSDCLNDELAFEYLNKAIEKIKQQARSAGHPISLVMVKDFESSQLPHAKQLAKYGFHEVQGQPNMVMNIRPEWQTYDDYLASMSSKYRVRAKKMRKKAAKLYKKELDLNEMQIFEEQIYHLYQEVASKAELNLTYLNKTYFTAQKQAFGDQFHVIGYFLEDKLVAFICNYVDGQHVESHFVGYDYSLNRPYALYNNILYDIVELGINRGVQQISFGRTSSEIKSTVGAVGLHLNSFVRHKNMVFNAVLNRIINQLRADEWTPRNPFKNQ
ncbi:MAG: GNAT family N-acetyltransferase [Chitinophagales bacterium]